MSKTVPKTMKELEKNGETDKLIKYKKTGEVSFAKIGGYKICIRK